MHWHACLAAALLSGCQAIQVSDDTRIPDEMTFVKMWNRYTHCRSHIDATQMWQDAQQLNRTVRLMDRTTRAARLLPDTIEQTLADPPSRVAVDPKAMAATCTLLAAEAAQDAGHARLAGEMFRFVLANFADSPYAYYREQAQLGLDRIKGDPSDQVVITLDRELKWLQ